MHPEIEKLLKIVIADWRLLTVLNQLIRLSTI